MNSKFICRNCLQPCEVIVQSVGGIFVPSKCIHKDSIYESGWEAVIEEEPKKVNNNDLVLKIGKLETEIEILKRTMVNLDQLKYVESSIRKSIPEIVIEKLLEAYTKMLSEE